MFGAEGPDAMDSSFRWIDGAVSMSSPAIPLARGSPQSLHQAASTPLHSHVTSSAATHPMTPYRLILAFLLLCLAPAAHAQSLVEYRGAGDLFHAAGLRGTFVLATRGAPQIRVHGLGRAAQRFVPASTFKIPNTLIGLATGAVADVDEVLPYGGQPQWQKAWERDMSLREAMPISNVPVYQELARRIGRERMAEGVQRLAYGSMEIGEVVDRFWLDGPLAISALEQVAFLTRLAEGRLPLPAEAQAATREILRIDGGVDARGDAWTLYAKTGTSLRDAGGIGWWVGWVERGDALHVFALNVDFASQADMPRRVPLGRALLVRMGALPGG